MRYYWRGNAAVLLGVAVASAALTGALLVGDSLRGSLRSVALESLGSVDWALRSERFFQIPRGRRASLEDAADAAAQQAVPAIFMAGGASNPNSGAQIAHIQIFGVRQDFWPIAAAGSAASELQASLRGRGLIVNQTLADAIGVRGGEDVLLRVGSPAAIPAETLLGKRDRDTATLRGAVAGILPAAGIGRFALAPQQRAPATAFVDMDTLQRTIDRAGRANVLLLPIGATERSESDVRQLARREITLRQCGIRWSEDAQHGAFVLESDSLFLEPPVERAALELCRRHGYPVAKVLTYLADRISAVPRDAAERSLRAWRALASPADRLRIALAAPRVVPYSVVTAIDATAWFEDTLEFAGSRPSALAPGEIWLSEWTRPDLLPRLGQPIELAALVDGPDGAESEFSSTFTLTALLRLSGGAADPRLAPRYPGITTAESLTDWDAPFPVDLRRIRPRDERFWAAHRATPKAFISLEDGVRMWIRDGERFGRLTSIRVPSAALRDAGVQRPADALNDELAELVAPADLGLRFEPVRRQALQASQGNVDFGGLFIGFSFFLIVAALLLGAMLMRLAVEQRAGELGLLLAIGHAPRQIRRGLLMEGAALALGGATIGAAAGVGYAALMLWGLETLWSDAVRISRLELHVSIASVAIGALATFALSLGALALTTRGLLRRPPRRLMSGGAALEGTLRRERGLGWIVPGVAGAAALLLGAAAALGWIAQSAGYFLTGAAALGCGVLVIRAALLDAPRWRLVKSPSSDDVDRRMSSAGFVLRSAARRPGRSLLTVGLVAMATFLIVSLEAFRIVDVGAAGDRGGPSGGFAYIAESAAPLVDDLNTETGREHLSLSDELSAALSQAHVQRLRLRPGDETSCLGLYRAANPRLAGAPRDLLERGGFRFAAVESRDAATRENPWRLLEQDFPDGAIPAIGDEAAVRWQLHSGLGQDLEIIDERGQPQRLRFVALLSGSALQSELIVAESAFLRLFPGTTGYRLFLIDAPRAGAELATALERELAAYAFDAEPIARRLAEYASVQNTYIRTFQALGAIGLLLGTLGLSVVMLRNVLERRGELALMRAVGFRRATLARLVLSENAALAGAGLIVGTGSALVAVLPSLRAGAPPPWVSMFGLLAATFAFAMLSVSVAARSAFRAPLLGALRAE